LLKSYLKVKAHLFLVLNLILIPPTKLISNEFYCPQYDSTKNIIPDTTAYEVQLPEGTQQLIEYLDFKNTDIKDVLRSLGTKYNLNIFVENDVDVRITIHLTNISVLDALNFIIRENGLLLNREGNIFKVSNPPLPEPEPPPPLEITFENGLLSMDLQNENLEKAIYEISLKSGKNILLNQGVQGRLSGFIQEMAFEPGLKTLLAINGFIMRKRDGVYLIDYDPNAIPNGNMEGQNSRTAGRGFWIEVKDSLVSLDVTNVEIKNLVEEISRQLEIDIIFYGEIKGQISARCTLLPLDQALSYIFGATNYTFRKDGAVYLIGDKNVQGITCSRLIKLKYLKAEGIIEILPQSIISKATLKIIKEHNGIIIIGCHDIIRETEDFISQIDHPVPQILIEALVLDLSTTDISEFGIEAGTMPVADSSKMNFSFFPSIEVDARSDYMNRQIAFYGPQLGLPQVGKLPANFYVKLKALETEGKANVRSRPQIATLNGHTASISIGTTQYYIIKSQTPYGYNYNNNNNQQQSQPYYLQQSERFEKITAQMELKITPWVSASGEITVEINHEFSTPKGNLDPNRPPTIDHRILDSTVRLRDGETIILGGLRQTVDNVTISKFPILGSIPLLGRLFQNRSKNKTTSELLILVTPHLNHVYSGDEKGVIK
jgi:type IV pilus assembly protein PilQ